MAEVAEKPESPPDDQFLDDLSAAIRLKSFLVGAGREVPKDVTKGMAELVAVFDEDIRAYERRVREDERNNRCWRKLAALFTSRSVPNEKQLTKNESRAQ
jgi:hypothetical protein